MPSFMIGVVTGALISFAVAMILYEEIPVPGVILRAVGGFFQRLGAVISKAGERSK